MFILHAFLNLLFPPRCVGCGSMARWLCLDCDRSWRQQLDTRVTVYPDLPLPIFIAAKDYSDYLSKLLFAWKYQRYLQASETLQSLWSAAFVHTFGTTQAITLVPVPIHWFKYWQRGFNQAEQLSQLAVQSFAVEQKLLLSRRHYTATQVGLTKTQRQENLVAAFEVDNQIAATIPKENLIVLVDDIVTSGTTLLQCQQVLHQAGFHHIVALVLHRGTRSAL